MLKNKKLTMNKILKSLIVKTFTIKKLKKYKKNKLIQNQKN